MKRLLIITTLLALALLVFSCGGGSSKSLPTAGGTPQISGDNKDVRTYELEKDFWTWDLIAGQNMNVGTVTIKTDGDHLHIDYLLNDAAVLAGWEFYNYHIGMWLQHPDKGNPGSFQLKLEFNNPADYETHHEFTFTYADLKDVYGIPVSVKNNFMDIAIHAGLTRQLPTGSWESVTIWGGHWIDGNPGYGDWDWDWAPGKGKWGGGLTISFPLPVWDTMYHAVAYGDDSYWNVSFPVSPELPFPHYHYGDSNHMDAWCVDRQYSNQGWIGPVDLISCYDTEWMANHSFVIDPDWDLISYIINKKNHSGYPSSDWYALQDAIWYFYCANGAPQYFHAYLSASWLTDVKPIIDDAIANGEGYHPTAPGDWFAVLVYPNQGGGITPNLWTRYQMLILEVDP